MSEKPVASIKALARYEPDTVYIGTGEYVAECVRADDGDYYLAADVDAAIEALLAERDRLATTLQAEVEALREEVNGTIRELLAERVQLAAENARLREEIGRLLDSREREGDRLDWLLARLPGDVIRNL